MMCIGPCIILIAEELNPTRCHLLVYYAHVRLNIGHHPVHHQELTTIALVTI